MRQNLFIIDRWGRRSANYRNRSYWNRGKQGVVSIDWPSFNQLVARADGDTIVQALRTFARMLEVELVDVTDEPHRWEEGIVLHRVGAHTAVTEPEVDLSDRLLRPETADAIVGLLAEDAAFYGYDEATETLHVTVYRAGVPTLEWWDSELPGPSFARTFETNGRATDEDPRLYALRAMDLAPTSSMVDRVSFVEQSLAPFEIEELPPATHSLDILRVLRFAETS